MYAPTPRLSLAIALAVAVFSTAGCATSPPATEAERPAVEAAGFAAWDADGDGVLEEEEFSAGVRRAGIFARWDADGDGALDRGEVRDGFFETWDVDASGQLDEVEFRAGINTWSAADEEDFGDLDADADGQLTRQEFADAEVGEVVDDWDEDGSGVVEEAEFGPGLFAAWDANRSGMLEDDEFLL